MDHFTRFIQAYATKSKAASTVVEKLYGDFIMCFGYPALIYHDQGLEFENELMKGLEKVCGIKHSRTTPYHPQGNGQVERFNQTLLSMLRTLPETKKSRWKESLKNVVYAYNCTKHSVTGFSPFFLLFGRSPRLPIDLIFNTKPSEVNNKADSYPAYTRKWKKAMQDAYGLASKKSITIQHSNKEIYDQRVRSLVLQPNDRVLVRNLSERGGPGILRSFWENNIHCVVKRLNDDSPDYQIISERDVNGKIRTLHRNLLLPCDQRQHQLVPAKTRTSLQKPHSSQSTENDSAEDLSTGLPEGSDDEDEILLFIQPDSVQERQYRPPTPYYSNHIVNDCNDSEPIINQNSPAVSVSDRENNKPGTIHDSPLASIQYSESPATSSNTSLNTSFSSQDITCPAVKQRPR